MEGLATMLLNIVTKKARIEQIPALKTLAIGASTYGNVRVGMGHYTPNSASTFLQLRIYHVNYDCRYRNFSSPKLHLIARGRSLMHGATPKTPTYSHCIGLTALRETLRRMTIRLYLVRDLT